MAWLSFVNIYSNYSLSHKNQKIIEWTRLIIVVVRIVVVDIAIIIDIEHIVRVIRDRSFYLINLTNMYKLYSFIHK